MIRNINNILIDRKNTNNTINWNNLRQIIIKIQKEIGKFIDNPIVSLVNLDEYKEVILQVNKE